MTVCELLYIQQHVFIFQIHLIVHDQSQHRAMNMYGFAQPYHLSNPPIYHIMIGFHLQEFECRLKSGHLDIKIETVAILFQLDIHQPLTCKECTIY